jgi:hypothetical protein
MTKSDAAKIIKDGLFFRAVNEATGFRSRLVTSANQAGLIIFRRFGKEAYHLAAEAYIQHLRRA